LAPLTFHIQRVCLCALMPLTASWFPPSFPAAIDFLIRTTESGVVLSAFYQIPPLVHSSNNNNATRRAAKSTTTTSTAAAAAAATRKSGDFIQPLDVRRLVSLARKKRQWKRDIIKISYPISYIWNKITLHKGVDKTWIPSLLFFLSSFATSHKMPSSSKALQINNINPNFIAMEYAVRGPLVIRAGEIERELAKVSTILHGYYWN